jgi:predicted metal-binding membrane protein
MSFQEPRVWRAAVPAPTRLARWVAWHHPEVWPAVLAAVAWCLLVALAAPRGDNGVAVHYAETHHHTSAPTMSANSVPGLVWWTVMVVAMMVPLTLPAVRTVALNSLWARRYRGVGLYLLAYTTAWVGLGALALAAREAGERWSGMTVHNSPPALGAVLLVAAGWELTRWKRRALRTAHRTMPLAPRGRRADLSCISWGLVSARRCAGSCWAVMLVMTITHNLAVMALLTGVSLADRYRRRPALRASAAVLAGLAVVVLGALW